MAKNSIINYRKCVRWILPVYWKRDTSIVLIRRIKDWREYYVVPWWWIEYGENHEQTLEREMTEEINANIKINNLVVEYISKSHKTIQYFYICSHQNWKIKKWNWPEFTQHPDNNNFYDIEYINAEKLLLINIVPWEIKPILLKILNWDIPTKIIIKK
jgi:8-oxo-dGTP pyrophosphatase MutT (NUDIX family)